MSEQRHAVPRPGASGDAAVEHPRLRPGRPCLAVSPADTVGCALALLREHRVRRLPVVSDDRCVALLTERDLVRCLATAGDVAAATTRTVGSVCPGPAPAVEAGTPLPAIAATLLAADADAAVVVSRGVLVGVVDTSDVLGAIRTRGVERSALDDLAALDWIIPSPR